ncbi:hypothetical protein KVV02_006424 [Mortierella alpina]|uniref:V-type proton ATPase subunit c' n=1 Tax=Mortierella alpina TaxID=64518 RepID=A0A9P8D3A2_MORAP|nr:hypothetical protein KVV02_006424 [Mortierella alpina]
MAALPPIASDFCPPFAPFFGLMGVASAMVFSSMGAGYGTFKSGIGIAGMGTFRPELMMKALIPVVMAGIISVYGLVISVLIAGSLSSTGYSLYAGFVHLGAGLCVGLTGLAAGYAIGIVGDVCVRGYAYQPRLFVAMVLVLIFAEVLGLYGLIVGLILNTKAHAGNSSHTSFTRPTSPPPPARRQPSSSSAHTGGSAIYSVDYSTPNTKANNTAASTPVLPGVAYISPSASANSLGSPTSTLQGTTAHHPSRGKSPTMSFSNVPLAEPTRWKSFRLKVMRMATVERLQLLWGLLALFGTMSWLALIPAYAFRNKFEVAFSDPAYTMFLVATIGTSVSAIWQSLCPFLIRQSQRALLPRIINHPGTQTATIIISVILTVLNFLSWMVLAADSDRGARTDCLSGRLSDQPGFTAQCRGVNTAIVLDVVVFFLWIPIAVVIVCGTVERGLWWWGEDDGWAQGETIVGGSNMMSEEEFDLKIGMGGSKHIKRRQTVHPENLAQQEHAQDRVMIQQPKPAFVTPIASQFRPDPFSPRAYQDSAVEREIKQRAATALHDYSVLLLHALPMNETPTKARLRMFRHLTGQAQPPHEHTPPAQRKQKDVASEHHGLSTLTTAQGLFNPVVSSSSSGSTRMGAAGGSSTVFGLAGGGGHASSFRTTATTATSATTRHSSVPVDEEFGHTYFQGPLSS